MSDNTDYTAVLGQLEDIRREVIRALVPFVSEMGFKAIPNRLVPSPVIMLPPSDYAILSELLLPPKSSEGSSDGGVTAATPGDAPTSYLDPDA